jgi:phosphocarrier protein
MVSIRTAARLAIRAPLFMMLGVPTGSGRVGVRRLSFGPLKISDGAKDHLLLKVTGEQGIHARPASSLVKAVMDLQDVEVDLHSIGRSTTLRSILGVLTLGLRNGDLAVVTFKGKEARSAREALLAVINGELKDGVELLTFEEFQQRNK